jgi:ferritin
MKSITDKIQNHLNNQILMEGDSSQFYLSMASWADTEGYSGVAEFLYRQSDEEKEHMLKLIRFVNERGGKSVIPGITKPQENFNSLTEIFNLLLEHEIKITKSINNIVDACLKEKDYTTYNFMQWYVTEQIEEEATAKSILDRIKLTGEKAGGLYLFDKDINNLIQTNDEEM